MISLFRFSSDSPMAAKLDSASSVHHLLSAVLVCTSALVTTTERRHHHRSERESAYEIIGSASISGSAEEFFTDGLAHKKDSNDFSLDQIISEGFPSQISVNLNEIIDSFSLAKFFFKELSLYFHPLKFSPAGFDIFEHVPLLANGQWRISLLPI